ncbi:excinuclease ABC subunit UvrA [Aristaeella lactis]|uniref:Excinuclease ABC subunit A n=1 Tax=Aristaeella lactis TaxID=3046383 RepID=A0AC61PQK3_9FIRM|nr:excinuclease ABC subunit UvrA [Aristaeella lactis]QUA52362.1 excinuclease ABC subunit UvrA [Aristaeella lactis]SMC92456.1 excinuclease ABC subunit A [Aristaeella lactis]
MNEFLTIRGAREHNLKNISLRIPRDKLTVITGLSGSGKSSLAFDTIYAEGQRRYVESLTSYARQFLGQMDKPDVDAIEGLSPAISIDQKTTGRNPRSTVGTVTEIHDYLRLLWARVGVPHCPVCGREIRKQSVDEIVDAVCAVPEGTRMQILSPLVRGRKGEHRDLLSSARKSGYVRVRIDGEMYDLEDTPELDKKKKHTIEIVVDRLIRRDTDEFRHRLAEDVETASVRGAGLVIVDCLELGETLYSMNYACPDCGVSIEELEPRMFSFNSPYGACPACSGLGIRMKISREAIFPDERVTLREGAMNLMGFNASEDGGIAAQYFGAMGKKYGFSLDTPLEDISGAGMDALLYGTGDEQISITYEGARGQREYTTSFEGIIPTLERRYRETTSDAMKQAYEEYMAEETCPECGGQRLKAEARAVTVGGKSLPEVSDMSIRQARDFFASLELDGNSRIIAAQILKEIDARLGFLCDVGLDYLTLSRGAGTLSGGEAQRIRLATQIGSALMGVMYILDEPSIGLHQRDNAKLIATLRRMRDLGNTVIVVEHDEETMLAADWIVDVGPGAGLHGGYIVAEGTADDIRACPESLTGQYLSGKKVIPVPKTRRKPTGWLTVRGAAEHNLKHIDVRIPLGVLTCVTGVSGSGKSSLVNEIVYKNLARKLNRAKTRPGCFDSMEGLEQLDKIIMIDQSPIGRTPRSNPATYTGLFDLIRKLFALSPEAKARGYKENRFSFNVKGGRCEACQGDGMKRIEMHFLPDLYVPCDVCHGHRYNRETLEVTWQGKNISEVLDMTVEEALGFFENHPQIMRKLETLYDVGLGYMKLGQASTTLSGGEAQRVKLATELSRRATGKTIYLLDEPTTGLHMADVDRLILVLQRLTDAGNSVLVIEHNLDVIKVSDHIIDLGPEGGSGGGTVVAEGTPEQVAAVKGSYTGEYLKKVL